MTKHNGNRSLSTKDLRSLINTTTPIAYAMHTNESAEMSEKKNGNNKTISIYLIDLSND